MAWSEPDKRYSLDIETARVAVVGDSTSALLSDALKKMDRLIGRSVVGSVSLDLVFVHVSVCVHERVSERVWCATLLCRGYAQQRSLFGGFAWLLRAVNKRSLAIRKATWTALAVGVHIYFFFDGPPSRPIHRLLSHAAPLMQGLPHSATSHWEAGLRLSVTS